FTDGFHAVTYLPRRPRSLPACAGNDRWSRAQCLAVPDRRCPASLCSYTQPAPDPDHCLCVPFRPRPQRLDLASIEFSSDVSCTHVIAVTNNGEQDWPQRLRS